MGDAGTVGLVAPRDLTVTVPSGALPAMQAKVVYAGPIKAPIKAGQHIADLVIQMPDTGPQTVPLVAARAVGEAGFFRRARPGLPSLSGSRAGASSRSRARRAPARRTRPRASP